MTLRSSTTLLALCCAAVIACSGGVASTVRAADEPSGGEGVTIGHVDAPAAGVITEPKTVVSGWALSRKGLARVEIIVDGRVRTPANLGVERSDVKAAHPEYPDSDRAGFDAKVSLEGLAMGRHEVEIVATDRAGRTTLLGRRVYVNPAFRELWAGLLAARGHRPGEVFHFVFATSHVAEGGGAEIDTEYAPFVSETMKVGVRVPILYLRTTRGRAGDWVFDPDFDITKSCGSRKIAEDSLHGVLKWSVEHKVPVLFTLNGGIWADAACDVPEWDINDWLEQDPLNCQWNEHNEVMPDDYLRHLPGSQDAPELARALTLNVYASKVRHYKKRNLQQAASIIHAFADAHPDLFIGISLDPDVYMNPFFEGKQWYDFNPGTLRQFREWLRGTGPYAGKPSDGAPDLSSYRLARPYTLDKIRLTARSKFPHWADVDPPRTFKPEQTMLKTRWATMWERFRRHIVDLHYDELSQWVAETGIDPNRIFSSQGFNAPGPAIEPFPLRIDSPPKNYDTGGMTVQGAVPSFGHLGAILYGQSAVNHIKMEGRESLFRVFRDFDPDWAVVEYNTANFQSPQTLPGPSPAYRGLRDIVNFGAQLVSPMAWNGSPGTEVGKPGFVGYTSYRAAPLETAARNLMIHRANLPRQARLWGFGLGIVADSDGWRASGAARAEPTERGLRVAMAAVAASKHSSPRLRRTRLDSPPALDFRTQDLDLLVLGVEKAPADLRIAVQGRDRGSKAWRELVSATQLDTLLSVRAGYVIALPHSARQLEQLRLVLDTSSRDALTFERIALYPAVAPR